eukprot:1205902-Prymnesium_polylepis.1
MHRSSCARRHCARPAHSPARPVETTVPHTVTPTHRPLHTHALVAGPLRRCRRRRRARGGVWVSQVRGVGAAAQLPRGAGAVRGGRRRGRARRRALGGRRAQAGAQGAR